MSWRLHHRVVFWNLILLSAFAALVVSFVDVIRTPVLFALLLSSISVLLFGTAIRRLISIPLDNMAAAARRLADGDYGTRLPITGDEAIAALGSSLNTLAERLNQKVLEHSIGEQRLTSMLDSMAEGLVVTDSDGRVTMFNRSIQDMLGSDRDLRGRTPLELFRNGDLDEAIRRVREGSARQSAELHMSGTRTFEANVTPLRGSGLREPAVPPAVIVLRDVTEVRRMERIRREFVANVSHEFKTPLTSIRGYAETLLSGALDEPEVAREFLQIIERNARNLESLVADLLTLGRIESEEPVAAGPVDVRRTIDDQIGARASMISKKGIGVQVDCPLGEIQADGSRLGMAIGNLIDNAIHYNRQNGEIRVTGRYVDGTFEVAVTDTGCGIPADELPRIFERFYRVDKARSRDAGGTGLGLSIVKHAIETQGGSVAVTSKVGSGSTFTIRLPQTRAD